MKRLKLDAFKAKQQDAQQDKVTQQLLGQVLGDCHDKPIKKSGTIKGEYPWQ